MITVNLRLAAGNRTADPSLFVRRQFDVHQIADCPDAQMVCRLQNQRGDKDGRDRIKPVNARIAKKKWLIQMTARLTITPADV